MRQYYDIYCLLDAPEVLDFIGTQAYETHKIALLPKADLEIPLSDNEAFLLTNPETRAAFKERYLATASLYYKGQPDFEDVLERIQECSAFL